MPESDFFLHEVSHFNLSSETNLPLTVHELVNILDWIHTKKKPD